MHLPLLISKASWIKLKMFQNDYKIGCLLKDDNKCYWTTWGSCKDLESALKCVKDFIKETGEIDDTNKDRIRLINYIKVKPNATYKIDITNLVLGNVIALRCYDISKTYMNSGMRQQMLTLRSI